MGGGPGKEGSPLASIGTYRTEVTGMLVGQAEAERSQALKQNEAGVGTWPLVHSQVLVEQSISARKLYPPTRSHLQPEGTRCHKEKLLSPHFNAHVYKCRKPRNPILED